jgi:hypothetical protein
MNLRDALDTAAIVETELRDRYAQIADMMQGLQTMGIAVFFRHMADKQERLIVALRRRRQALFGETPIAIDVHAVLGALQAPDFSELRAYMSPEQALRAALQCERRIRRFFTDRLFTVGDDAVRNLFVRLARADLEHEDALREEVTHLAFEDSLDDLADTQV